MGSPRTNRFEIISSPCSKCVVYAMCQIVCEEASDYIDECIKKEDHYVDDEAWLILWRAGKNIRHKRYLHTIIQRRYVRAKL